jgi:Fe2+ or Zn2+ uptake regulation protein
MPGLREDVIDAICGEDWPNPDYEVSSSIIYERLRQNGVNTSKAEVEQVLDHLQEQKQIILVLDPRSGIVVQDVAQGLCPPPQP